jgi:hypothetical protein
MLERPAGTSISAPKRFIDGKRGTCRGISRVWRADRAGRAGCGRPRRRRSSRRRSSRCASGTRGGGRTSWSCCSAARGADLHVYGWPCPAAAEGPRAVDRARRTDAAAWGRFRRYGYAVRKPKAYTAQRPGDLVEIDTLDVRPLPSVIVKHFTGRSTSNCSTGRMSTIPSDPTKPWGT